MQAPTAGNNIRRSNDGRSDHRVLTNIIKHEGFLEKA
jgi:hypothetical protein